MNTAREKNKATRTSGTWAGDAAGGTPAARSRKASTAGETAAAGPDQQRTRGYIKLSSATKAFNFDFRGKTVLDIGSSTGGFTKYALEKGAKKVIAIEKGTNQMTAPLRFDPRVDLHEKTNIFDVKIGAGMADNVFTRDNLRPDRSETYIPAATEKAARRADFPGSPAYDVSDGLACPEKDISARIPTPDIILADVSFVSLKKVLSHAKNHLAGNHTDFIVMLKPQFEATPNQLVGGIIKNNSIRRDIIKDFEKWLKQNHFLIIQKIDNKLKGTHGNLERFYHLKLAK